MAKDRAYGVVGAGWGDEGKGLSTDALSARLIAEGHEVTVVRSNGGAQAGHGVESPEGEFHVFHHIGAGTFAGAKTHLSRHFVAHPMVFGPEYDSLGSLCSRPEVSIDPRAIVTTPFDLAINQVAEVARGDSRHGSCGLGFGEAIERDENGPILRIADLVDPAIIQLKLNEIIKTWVPARLAALGVEKITDGMLREIIIDAPQDLIEPFLKDCRRFMSLVDIRGDETLGANETIVFEGAQGLHLDMDLGDFPHVTRSHTGAFNMAKICAEAGIEELHPLYVTRAYATRHGNGPFPMDRGTSPLDGTKVTDRTNLDNEWQGSIRYAPLDMASQRAIVARDISRSRQTGVRISPALGITCLDQVKGEVEYMSPEHGLMKIQGPAISGCISLDSNLPLMMTSFGPKRDDVIIDETLFEPDVGPACHDKEPSL